MIALHITSIAKLALVLGMGLGACGGTTPQAGQGKRPHKVVPSSTSLAPMNQAGLSTKGTETEDPGPKPEGQTVIGFVADDTVDCWKPLLTLDAMVKQPEGATVNFNPGDGFVTTISDTLDARKLLADWLSTLVIPHRRFAIFRGDGTGWMAFCLHGEPNFDGRDIASSADLGPSGRVDRPHMFRATLTPQAQRKAFIVGGRLFWVDEKFGLLAVTPVAALKRQDWYFDYASAETNDRIIDGPSIEKRK